MQTEFEAKFYPVEKEVVRDRLKKAGADPLYPEGIERRVNFHLPPGKKSDNAWIRIRQESKKTTLSLKMILGEKIEDQKELELTINSFDTARAFLNELGCEQKASQESKREAWKLNNVLITIDEWPFLKSYIEIEGPDEQSVKDTATLLRFEWPEAIFGSVNSLYKKTYGKTLDELGLKEFGFGLKENPFLTEK